MKCAKCGTEIKVGCIYCSTCGQEAQIVSDSGLLEDELLRELLQEKARKSRSAEQQRSQRSQEQKPQASQNRSGQKQPDKKVSRQKQTNKKPSGQKHLPLIISLSCLCALLILSITLIMVMRNQRSNSFEYQVQKAEACVSEKNYARALNFYQRALEMKEDDIEIRLAMVDLHILMEEERTAISMLQEILKMDPDNASAYEKLIAVYHDKKDYEAILELKKGVTDKELLKLFSNYEVEVPTFSKTPGTYTDTLTIEILAEEKYKIYYTTDGSDPVEKGKAYEKPVEIEEQGTVKLQAVCCNEYGIYSEVADGEFVVAFEKPEMPTAFPDGGDFTAPATVELSTTVEGHIYYTWDGTEPTAESEEYTAPIEIPEGNNILSAIVVDKHGMMSEVLKCNYKYLP